MNGPSKRLSWILLLASAALFFLPLGTHSLWNSDEGRYAEIAREMLELGDWISPHLNYVLYFEKPPLVYWLTAASLAVFGETEFAARFWCALFGLLTVFLVYRIGRFWKSERAGLLAGTILATSTLFFALTQFLVLDMAVTFWLTLALLAASHVLMERPPEKIKRYMDLLALAVAGAVLTKGLIGLLFPVAALAIVIFYSKLWGQAGKISWQPPLILMLVITVPWFVLVSLKHPSFPYIFFIHEHVARFCTTVHNCSGPWYFYLPVLLVGFLPWSAFLPEVLRSAFSNQGMALKRDPVRALLVFWSFFILVFFSASRSKLAGYCLPVFPAIALLVGAAFDDVLDSVECPPWLQRGMAGVIAFYAVFLAMLKFPMPEAVLGHPVVLLIRSRGDELAVVMGLSIMILVGVWGMRQSVMCVTGLVTVQVLLFGVLTSIAPTLDPFYSNKGMARYIAQHAEPIERVIAYGVSYERVCQTLPFYLKERIGVFGHAGELRVGRDLDESSEQWFSRSADARAAVVTLHPGTWVVTNEEHFKGLVQAGYENLFERSFREGKLILLHKIR